MSERIPDERVLELTQIGLTARVIGDVLGCSKRGVERSRKRLGITTPAAPRMTEAELTRAEELLAEGASLSEVSRTIGRSTSGVQKRFAGRGWTREQIGEHVAMLRQFGGVL